LPRNLRVPATSAVLIPADEAPPEEEALFGEEALEEDIPEEALFGEELPEDFTEEAAEELEIPGDEDTPGEAPEEAPEDGTSGDPDSALSEEPAIEPAAPEEPAAPSAGPVPPPGPALQVPRDSGPPQKKPKLQPESMLGLMRYLKDLAGSLPGKNRDTFMQSDARVSMEYIIDSLEGRKGLFKGIQERLPQEAKVPKEASAGIKTADVAGTLRFLGKLASALPDQGLSTAITRKVDSVVTGIRSVAED
jgi:hypothetical protein